MTDDASNAKIRAIIERPIAELVEIGLEGGRPAAIHMLAFQMILRLDGLNDVEALTHLRKECDDAISAITAETGGVH